MKNEALDVYVTVSVQIARWSKIWSLKFSDRFYTLTSLWCTRAGFVFFKMERKSLAITVFPQRTYRGLLRKMSDGFIKQTNNIILLYFYSICETGNRMEKLNLKHRRVSWQGRSGLALRIPSGPGKCAHSGVRGRYQKREISVAIRQCTSFCKNDRGTQVFYSAVNRYRKAQKTCGLVSHLVSRRKEFSD